MRNIGDFWVSLPTWGELVEWFIALPIHFQILVVIGTFLLIAATLVLIYYIFKGIYLLLKHIFKGISKLFKELYWAISGKTKPGENAYIPPVNSSANHNGKPTSYSESKVPNTKYSLELKYCPECGNEATSKMIMKLEGLKSVFCVYCGTEIHANS